MGLGPAKIADDGSILRITLGHEENKPVSRKGKLGFRSVLESFVNRASDLVTKATRKTFEAATTHSTTGLSSPSYAFAPGKYCEIDLAEAHVQSIKFADFLRSDGFVTKDGTVLI